RSTARCCTPCRAPVTGLRTSPSRSAPEWQRGGRGNATDDGGRPSGRLCHGEDGIAPFTHGTAMRPRLHSARPVLIAPMPHGLSRKIRIAFILQMVMASLAIVVAFFVVGTLFKYSFIRGSLQEEALHYWELREASPAQPPPNAHALRGYLVEP